MVVNVNLYFFVSRSMPEFQEISIVCAHERLTGDVYRLTLRAPAIAAHAKPGQFVMIACAQGGYDPLLRRPFSLHQTSAEGTVQIFYKVVGRGTQQLAAVVPGQELSLLGPLGRGFCLIEDSPVCLVGGGIGIAPLLFLARQVIAAQPAQPPVVLLGARTAAEVKVLAADFSGLGCQVQTATDDGSLGHHGYVSALLTDHLDRVAKVYVCGPKAMMAEVARQCLQANRPCEVSLETHMACGLGACLGCTVHGADGAYRHVCKHGPVMAAQEVAWNR